ncbi:MAG: hypothetical protein Q8P20_06765 [bacterium]|nr:hypothetical protein [bacterium]
MTQISQPTIKFLNKYGEGFQQGVIDPDETKIKIQMTISRVASVYEKIRNAIEFKDEHLLRKNAIQRMLKRRIYTEEKKDQLGSLLISELIRAKYLVNDTIPERVIGEVDIIIEKYLALLKHASPNRFSKKNRNAANWILSVMATQIEHHLVPPIKDDAIVEYMYQVIRGDVNLAEDIADPVERDLQVYIAIHRALIKSDYGILRYHLLNFWVPGWMEGDPDSIENLHRDFYEVKERIDSQIQHPFANRLFRFVKRFSGLFVILKDLVEKNYFHFDELLSNPQSLEQEIRMICTHRYDKAKSKLRRSYVRTIIYIFLTKMMLALIIELPFELFILNTTYYTPLIANVIFHPILMFIIAASIFIPSEKNTNVMVDLLMKVFYQEPHPEFLYAKQKTFGRSKIVTMVFSIIYALTFLLSFGLLIWALNILNFNWVSILLFAFFLTIISFFGMKLRNEAKELVIVPQKDNIISALINFFTLPILRVGQWISAKAPKINIFLFILDFIIEAPFKIFIEVVEDWITYQKEKREELF